MKLHEKVFIPSLEGSSVRRNFVDQTFSINFKTNSCDTSISHNSLCKTGWHQLLGCLQPDLILLNNFSFWKKSSNEYTKPRRYTTSLIRIWNGNHGNPGDPCCLSQVLLDIRKLVAPRSSYCRPGAHSLRQVPVWHSYTESLKSLEILSLQFSRILSGLHPEKYAECDLNASEQENLWKDVKKYFVDFIRKGLVPSNPQLLLCIEWVDV